MFKDECAPGTWTSRARGYRKRRRESAPILALLLEQDLLEDLRVLSDFKQM